MADNSAQNATDTIATDDVTSLNGSASSGVKVQRMKVGFGDDNSYRDASAAFPLPVSLPVASTGTITAPAISTTSFTVLAANTARLGAAIFNDSSQVVYIGLTASVVSTTAYTVQIPAGGYYELPAEPSLYVGKISGIAAAASGNLRVTELTA